MILQNAKSAGNSWKSDVWKIATFAKMKAGFVKIIQIRHGTAGMDVAVVPGCHAFAILSIHLQRHG